MNERTILIKNEKNEEIEMEILFTYEEPTSGETYVFYFNPREDSGEVFVSRYDEDNQLFAIEDETLWNRLNQILIQYQEEEAGDEDE